MTGRGWGRLEGEGVGWRVGAGDGMKEYGRERVGVRGVGGSVRRGGLLGVGGVRG